MTRAVETCDMVISLPKMKTHQLMYMTGAVKKTKQQLEQLAFCVKKLQEVTERICKEKIESFVASPVPIYRDERVVIKEKSIGCLL